MSVELLHKSRPAGGSFFGLWMGKLGLWLSLTAGVWAGPAVQASERGAESPSQALAKPGLGGERELGVALRGEGEEADGRLKWRVLWAAAFYSDLLPLRHLSRTDWMDLVQARPGRNGVLADQSVALQAGWGASGQHRWSLLARQMSRVVTDASTVQRSRQVASDQRDAQDWQWQPRLAYTAFSGSGLAWAYSAPVQEGGYAEAGAQALVLNSLSTRDFDGVASFNAQTQRYAFDVQSVESGSRLVFPFQKPFDGQGQALLLHGRWGWRAGSWHAAMGVRDAGWLQWRGLPQQMQHINSQNQVRDANGFIVYRALIQGQNSQPLARWTAPWTGELTLGRRMGGGTLSLPWEYVPQLGYLRAVRWQSQMGSVHSELTWREHQKDVLTQWRWRHWRLAFALGQPAYSQQWALGYDFVF